MHARVIEIDVLIAQRTDFLERQPAEYCSKAKFGVRYRSRP